MKIEKFWDPAESSRKNVPGLVDCRESVSICVTWMLDVMVSTWHRAYEIGSLYCIIYVSSAYTLDLRTWGELNASPRHVLAVCSMLICSLLDAEAVGSFLCCLLSSGWELKRWLFYRARQLKTHLFLYKSTYDPLRTLVLRLYLVTFLHCESKNTPKCFCHILKTKPSRP